MSSMRVTAEVLLGLAAQPAYQWMQSIETARLILRAGQASCGSCPAAQAAGPSLSKATYVRIAGSAKFQEEIKRVAATQGYDSVQIVLDGTTTQLPVG
jgi:hypothetical protein